MELEIYFAIVLVIVAVDILMALKYMRTVNKPEKVSFDFYPCVYAR